MWPFRRQRGARSRRNVRAGGRERPVPASRMPGAEAAAEALRQAGGAETVTWATNAPAGWPAVRGPRLEPHQAALAPVVIGARLLEGFEGSGIDAAFCPAAVHRLTPLGLLDVPWTVESDGVRRPVHVYVEASAENAARFHGADRLLRELGEGPSVWFAPEPLPETPPGDPCRPFDPGVFAPCRDPVPPGRWAMWWETEEDPELVHSPALEAMDRTWRALDGVESYAVADLLRGLGLVPGRTGRVALPPSATLPVFGPDHRLLVVTLSAEKGIQPRFEVDATPPGWRNLFWRLWADWAEAWRDTVAREGHPRDPVVVDGGPAAWWRTIRSALDEAGTDTARAPCELGRLLLEEPLHAYGP